MKIALEIRKALAMITAVALLTGTGCAANSSNDIAPNAFMAPASSAAALYDGCMVMPEAFNTEEYRFFEENGFRLVEKEPLSTFSADVDTASYSNVRRMLLDGTEIPADAVRAEEFINYFHYSYPQPEGDAPFSITTELAECPWQKGSKLMLIGLQAKDLDYSSLPPSNLVFLLDVSGSMNTPDKLPLLKEAFRLLTENLRDEDTVSIVTYAGNDQVVLDGAQGGERLRITKAIDLLEAGGSTAGSEGIKTAYEIAEKHFVKGGNNRIILATDGDLNVGITSESELTRLIERKRESGVFLTVLGFGEGNLKDNKLLALADHGNGNYAYLDSELEARKVLVEQLGGTLFTVAKDVKIQVEFNPSVVKEYRLIGYEKRLLDNEDFEDDQKDAGEIGAGHRVTALYELVLEDGQEDSGSDLLTLKIRYKEPDGATSKELEKAVKASFSDSMPENLAFAATAAQFAMLLKDSEYAGTTTYGDLAERLNTRPEVLDDEYKNELVTLIERAQK